MSKHPNTPRVMEESDREGVDSACRTMTASWVRNKSGPGTELCEFYENYDKNLSTLEIPRGVYTLEVPSRRLFAFHPANLFVKHDIK